MNAAADLERTMPSAPDHSFGAGEYSISAHLEPSSLSTGYPLPHTTSYDATAIQPWAQYLETFEGTNGQYSDPSYSLVQFEGLSQFSETVEGAWSLGHRDNYVGGDHTSLHAADIAANQSALAAQYRNGIHQINPGQQHPYADGLPTVSPDQLSRHSDSESLPQQHPGIEDAPVELQQRSSEQKTDAYLSPTNASRSKVATGTKRRDVMDMDDGAAQQSAEPSKKRVRKASTRKVLAPVDVWTPPSPVVLHASGSSNDLTGSAAFATSPVQQRIPPLPLLADGTISSQGSSSGRESADSRTQLHLTTTDGSGTSDGMGYVLSPTQTVSGLQGISPRLTTDMVSIPTPTSLRSHGSSFSSDRSVLTPTSSTYPLPPGPFVPAPSGAVKPAARRHTTSSRTSKRGSASSPPEKPTATPARRGRPAAMTTTDKPSKYVPSAVALVVAASSSAAAAAATGSGSAAYQSELQRGPGRPGLPPPEAKARNRLAASKCRQKSKVQTAEIVETEARLREANEKLVAERDMLQHEVFVVQSKLLLHTDCDCTLIQTYLVKRARALGEQAAREVTDCLPAAAASVGGVAGGSFNSDESYGSAEEEEYYEEDV